MVRVVGIRTDTRECCSLYGLRVIIRFHASERVGLKYKIIGGLVINHTTRKWSGSLFSAGQQQAPDIFNAVNAIQRDILYMRIGIG